MGMSTTVKGLSDPDHPEFKKHAAVLQACVDAGVTKLPKETADFFGGEYPEPYLLEERLTVDLPIREWDDEGRSGFEIDVADIPSDVKMIRFYNSW